jgi:hypothetical protein
MMETLIERVIHNLRGKHIKSTLLRLERIHASTPDVRKIVLDELNDLVREILKELGYDVEA